MKKYEIKKYKEGILPRVEELKKEVARNKKETKEDKKRILKFLLKTKSNHRNWTFQYENGEVYPKDVLCPDIRIIQYAEPHVLITDLYDEDRAWYRMPELIKGFAEESYLSYEMGFWLSSIASAINCCEYISKYEYLRYLNNKDKIKADELSKDRNFSLGSFKHEKNNYLEELNLNHFREKISYLNDVRISIYHFSPDREKEVSKKGKLEIEKKAPITGNMILPILAFRVYDTMIDLINQFYSKEKALDYLEECKSDWMNKKGIKEEDLK